MFKAIVQGLAVLTVLAGAAQADVVVSGKITTNTVWRAAAGPYVIKSTVFVSSNVTLTIEPGTIVKLSGQYTKLSVSGSLVAIGTADRRIVFTSLQDDSVGGDTGADGNTLPKPGDWQSIVVSGNSSTLRYADIRYGGAGTRVQSFGAVEVRSIANHEISYCSITNSQTAALYGYQGSVSVFKSSFTSNGAGISYSNSTITASDNDISYNRRMGVFTTNTSSLLLPRSTFLRNTISFNGEVAVSIYANPSEIEVSRMPTGNYNTIFGNNYSSSDLLPLQIVSAFFVPELDWTNNNWAYYSSTSKMADGTIEISCPIQRAGIYSRRMLVYQSTAGADCPKTPIGSLQYNYLQDGKLKCCYDQYLKAVLPF